MLDFLVLTAFLILCFIIDDFKSYLFNFAIIGLALLLFNAWEKRKKK